MDMQIYLSKADQVTGPYTLQEAKFRIARDEFGAGDQAWSEGDADWQPIESHPLLKGYCSAPGEQSSSSNSALFAIEAVSDVGASIFVTARKHWLPIGVGAITVLAICGAVLFSRLPKAPETSKERITAAEAVTVDACGEVLRAGAIGSGWSEELVERASDRAKGIIAEHPLARAGALELLRVEDRAKRKRWTEDEFLFAAGEVVEAIIALHRDELWAAMNSSLAEETRSLERQLQEAQKSLAQRQRPEVRPEVHVWEAPPRPVLTQDDPWFRRPYNPYPSRSGNPVLDAVERSQRRGR